ncbi:MAG: aminotransferase class I/II-fold pyridoxal phosphate-dependent enzyme [Clostridiales Family XIII bacterium]|nr:aminotransferase class I/II-fold pyridoxal phosphate-dependent enzyme [Clostridiales Family XIII bacterium]
MSEWNALSRTELTQLLEESSSAYEKMKKLDLKLDLSRGKPSPDVLDLSNAYLNPPNTNTTEDGTDIRNYGAPTGLPECKRLFSELLDIPPAQIFIGGNASLQLMYDTFAMLYLFGLPEGTPWCKEDKIKVLCPCPGYDRHFNLAADFGAELVVVPMTEDGPDMDIVEQLVASDPSIKAMWNVPLYSNPQGIVYSNETVRRLAKMKTAAPDFKLLWDNAYGVHHIWKAYQIENIFRLTEEAGNPERVLYFFSTSKILFPGGGIGLVAAGPATIKSIATHMSKQTIGYNKIPQLKTVELFQNAEGIHKHMQKIADLLRPKFEIVLNALEKEFSENGLLSWETPKGGYFVGVETMDGCAKRTVALAKEAGAVLTDAGATYPHKNDPRDSSIRIAPTYPSLSELQQTMDLFCICVKIAALEKLLEK